MGAGKLKRIFVFGIVGGVGTVVNMVVLYLLTFKLGVFYLASSVIATETAILSNFLGNHFFTFRDRGDPSPTYKKFLKFQAISIVTVIGTAFLLWLLTSNFGIDYLLVWNGIAIFVMFIVNYFLNNKFTWKELGDKSSGFIGAIFMIIFLSGSVSALVAVSQLGYHPNEVKEVVVYLDTDASTFAVKETSGKLVYSGELVEPRDYSGKEVRCQGNVSCQVGDFSDFKKQGSYFIETDTGEESPQFEISTGVYRDLGNVLTEFFEAQKQQGSDYHSDLHGFNDPPMQAIADGSFIMESPQASTTLIRLGSAYRRNPQFFDGNDYDVREYIGDYVEFLRALEGVRVVESNDGFRLNPNVEPQNVFVPGPTELESLKIYAPGSPPRAIKEVPVISLCGEDDGSLLWKDCIDFAEEFYKCQIDEPCLNLSYQEKRGYGEKVPGDYSVALGWQYEFGCFVDIDFSKEYFNDSPDPCLIFNDEKNAKQSYEALLAYLMAVPAVGSKDSSAGQELLDHSVKMYDFLDEKYPSRNSELEAYWGAASFLLFEYTGEQKYLNEAYAVRNDIGKGLVSDVTHPEEYYWELFALHEADLIAAGKNVNAGRASGVFRDKIYGDYKDRGELSIGANGEKVYVLDPNIRFQNSRYMLLEGIYSAKARELGASEAFIGNVASHQISWLAGKNAVQSGTAQGSDLSSQSFIFGVGEFPSEFHSRYLVDTGHASGSDGEVIGARGTNLMFNNGTEFVYFDGVSEVFGEKFGAIGNGYNGERKSDVLVEKRFSNGKRYIPGWINGAFDIPEDKDVIFNYEDNRNTYQFTESTNEIVAIALELAVYQDAKLNNIEAPNWSDNESLPQNETTYDVVIRDSTPEMDVTLVGEKSYASKTDSNGEGIIEGVSPGEYLLTGNKEGYSSSSFDFSFTGEEEVVLTLVQENRSLNATFSVDSEPPKAQVTVGGQRRNAPAVFNLEPGTYSVVVEKGGYKTIFENITFGSNESVSKVYKLGKGAVQDENGTLYLRVEPSVITDVSLNGINVGKTNNSGELVIGLTSGAKDVLVSAEGLEPYSGTIQIVSGETYSLLVQLNNNSSGENNSSNHTDGNSTVFVHSETSVSGEIFEDELAGFMVETSENAIVEWYVEGELVNTTSGKVHDFIWVPGVLFTAERDSVDVKAVSDEESVEWEFYVLNVVNPFFSPVSGSGGSELHVFTNHVGFDSLDVVIKMSDGSKKSYNLSSENFGNDTDWRKEISDFKNGVNYLIEIRGMDSFGQERVYTFAAEPGGRAFYKESPNNGGGTTSGGSRSGGGS